MRRFDPIAIPLGHVERHRPSRELSALTAEDLVTATVIRRQAAQLGHDLLASSTGHQEWRDIADDVRAEIRDTMIGALSKRLGDARMRARLLAAVGDVPLAQVERVARLERALDAARMLP